MDSLLELRLGQSSRLLIDTTQSVSEVAYNCGFNNISNFNRLFKKKKRLYTKRVPGKTTAMAVGSLFKLNINFINLHFPHFTASFPQFIPCNLSAAASSLYFCVAIKNRKDEKICTGIFISNTCMPADCRYCYARQKRKN